MQRLSLTKLWPFLLLGAGVCIGVLLGRFTGGAPGPQGSELTEGDGSSGHWAPDLPEPFTAAFLRGDFEGRLRRDAESVIGRIEQNYGTQVEVRGNCMTARSQLPWLSTRSRCGPLAICASTGTRADGTPFLGAYWLNPHRETAAFLLTALGPGGQSLVVRVLYGSKCKDLGFVDFIVLRLEPRESDWIFSSAQQVGQGVWELKVNQNTRESLRPLAVPVPAGAELHFAVQDRTGALSNFVKVNADRGSCREALGGTGEAPPDPQAETGNAQEGQHDRETEGRKP